MDGFSKNTQISAAIKIDSVGDGLFHVDGRTDRRIDVGTDVTKLIVTFCNFANAPRSVFISDSSLCN